LNRGHEYTSETVNINILRSFTMMKTKITNIIVEIKEIYKAIAPNVLKDKITEKASQVAIEQFEKELGIKLPDYYKIFLMNNDFEISFNHNYECLSLTSVISTWNEMNDLLEKGVFDDGRIERHVKDDIGNWDGDQIKKVWWNSYWIPFAEDSCSNMLCIDLDPGNNGTKHQLITLEIQDNLGPFLYKEYDSFLDYLEKNLGYLKNKQYTIDEDGYGDGMPMVEIDSDIDPDES